MKPLRVRSLSNPAVRASMIRFARARVALICAEICGPRRDHPVERRVPHRPHHVHHGRTERLEGLKGGLPLLERTTVDAENADQLGVRAIWRGGVHAHREPSPNPPPRSTVLAAARQCVTGLAHALIVVHPDTVVRWHRQWFRRQWTRRSAWTRPGRPSTNATIRTLVMKIAAANPLWGAPRIHGEVGKLGFAVSERTVSRLVRRPRRPPSQT